MSDEEIVAWMEENPHEWPVCNWLVPPEWFDGGAGHKKFPTFRQALAHAVKRVEQEEKERDELSSYDY